MLKYFVCKYLLKCNYHRMLTKFSKIFQIVYIVIQELWKVFTVVQGRLLSNYWKWKLSSQLAEIIVILQVILMMRSLDESPFLEETMSVSRICMQAFTKPLCGGAGINELI